MDATRANARRETTRPLGRTGASPTSCPDSRAARQEDRPGDNAPALPVRRRDGSRDVYGDTSGQTSPERVLRRDGRYVGKVTGPPQGKQPHLRETSAMTAAARHCRASTRTCHGWPPPIDLALPCLGRVLLKIPNTYRQLAVFGR